MDSPRGRWVVAGLLCLAALTVVAVASAAPTEDKAYPSPGQTEVWPGASISYGFDQAMDKSSVEGAFSMEPATIGDFVWSSDDRSLSFRAAEPLLASTLYRVTIGTGARTAGGAAVFSRPYEWTFTTSVDNAQVGFGYQSVPVQFVTPAGKRGLPLQPGYPRLTISAALYSLDMPAFAVRYAAVQPGVPSIDLQGLPLVSSWQAHVDASDSAGRLPLPDALAPGLYVLDVQNPRVKSAQTFLLYSDFALVAKDGRESRLAWVARVPEGTVAPTAVVGLYDKDGGLLAQATTDSDGLARFTEPGAAFAVADVLGQRTLVGLDSNWFSSGYYYYMLPGVRGGALSGPPVMAAYLHTDRPIYRPGHVLHYKATLRRFTADGFTLPMPTDVVTVTVKDPTGNTVALWNDVVPDSYGSLAGDMPLDQDASVGQWTYEVASAGQTFTGSFQVQEYVKPDYEVTVETDAPYYVTGDEAQVAVSAQYYFGQPATDADVTVRVFRGYYWWYERSGNQVGTYAGRTDKDGKWTVSIPVVTDVGRTWPDTYFFEAEVTDVSRRPVVADTSVPVYGADISLTVQNERYGVDAGQPVVITAQTRTHDDQPVAGRSVDFEVRQYRYDTGRGSYYEVVATDKQATGADGSARAVFRGLTEGWFTIDVTTTDNHGRLLETQTWAWIYSGTRPWYWRDGLEINADRDAYAPGDVAHLLVRSPVTTTALVTIERDDVYDEIVVPVMGATTVDLPIKAEYAPNVTAKVQLWQPTADAYRQAEGQLLTAEVTVNVPATDKRLAVEVKPDAAKYEPGNQAEFTITVRDAAGQPVRAQLSLAVVDKAVLALAQDTSGDIFDAFWGVRQDTVSTYESTRPSQWYNYALDNGAERGGTVPPAPGAPSPAPAAPTQTPDQASQAEPRREFPDTAYWNATLETDASGTVVVTMTLPDSLTTWEALARAIALDGRAGQGKGSVVVTKPVMADLALPRFAVQGDQFAVDVLGRNYVAGTLEASTSLESPGLVQLDPGGRQLALPLGETRFARWTTVASSIGTNTVTARLTTAAGADAIELPFDVQPFSVPERFARAGSTESEAVESFDVPYNAIPDGTSVEVRLAPGMALGVLDGLEDLIGYPYGCVEQTMSRMLPNAVIGRLVKELGVHAPEIEAQLPDMMAVGLQKLYGFQNPNGSWGWWYWQYSEGNVYTTAYVLHGLALTQAAGYEVDPGVLSRGFDWLAQALPGEKDPRIAAYAAYVQALAGHADPAVLTRLAGQADQMNAFSLAALAVGLVEVGRDDLASGVLDQLESQAVETVTTAYWPVDWENETYRYYYWYSMANDEKNTAMALDALALLRPDSRLGPKAARWLMENRWGSGWRTTQGTAFAVLGLTDYLITSGELEADYAWSVLLDGQVLASGNVDAGNITHRIDPVEVAGSQLPPGSHTLTMRKEGSGTLFYTVVGRLALFSDGFAEAQADGLGLKLARTYTGVAGRSGPDGWAVGDVVDVKLELTTPEELRYVIVEDMLPAGFEGLNETLDTETSKVPSQLPWRWWGYERKEVRDDKVTFFTSYLSPGTHVFEYAARAVTPGTFSARPAEAYTMYRPEVWGRSASQLVEVASSRVTDRPDLDGDYDRDCRLTDFDTQLVAQGWTDGKRDLNGDGRTDSADIGTANGRVGLQCGQGVPLPPAPAGQLALELRAPADPPQGQAFDVDVVLKGSGNVGAMDVTLDLPTDRFEVLGVSAGDLLADARLLGPVADGSSVRVGAFAKSGASLSGEAVVLRVQVRALLAGAGQIGVTQSTASTDRGAAYVVTANGTTVSPEPWAPRGTAYLPCVAH